MVNNVEMAHINTLKYTFSQMEIAKVPLNLGLPTYTQKMSTLFQSNPLISVLSIHCSLLSMFPCFDEFHNYRIP